VALRKAEITLMKEFGPGLADYELYTLATPENES
jgi:hypothetical protein